MCPCHSRMLRSVLEKKKEKKVNPVPVDFLEIECTVTDICDLQNSHVIC